MIRFRLFSVGLAALAAICARPASHAADELAPRLRHPVALAVSPDGAWLYAANERSGSVSSVEVAAGAARFETTLGGRLVDLQPVSAQQLVAVNYAGHEFILLEAKAGQVLELARVVVAQYPVGVAVLPGGQLAVVTSLWSRRLTLVSIAASAPRLTVRGTLDLDFAPRQALALDGRHVLVADNFAGRLAVMDTTDCKLLHTHEIGAHNIRGLALSADGKKVLVSHTQLNEYAQAFHSDITWGVLTSNSLHTFPVADLLTPKANLALVSELHQMGIPGQGGADPAGVAVNSAGAAVVALSGAGQVAFCLPGEIKVQRVPAGAYPTAVKLSPDGSQAFVAHTFDNAIGVYSLGEQKRTGIISLGSTPALAAADRGERLFHDARLAHDRWMSCETCHTNGHTNGGVNDNLTDGTFGAAKRVPSLLGCRDTGPYGWNGKIASLEQQMKLSISSTMQGKYRVPDEEAADLAAYLRTLPAPPSVSVARGLPANSAVARGQALFHSLNCKHCHAPATYTTPEVYDVGLKDEQGNHEFNPPSLRGVSQRERLFHDNRAGSVEEVLLKFKHQLEQPLSESDALALAAFLRSL